MTLIHSHNFTGPQQEGKWRAQRTDLPAREEVGTEGDKESDTEHEEAKEAAENINRQADNLLVLESAGTKDVTVAVRVRPLLEHESGEDKALITHGASVLLRSEKHVPNINISSKPRNFTFDAVMSEKKTTNDVFELVGLRAVMEVVRGVSAAVFAYGPTSSGKTFTLLGEKLHHSQDREPSSTRGSRMSSLNERDGSVVGDERDGSVVGDERDGSVVGDERDGSVVNDESDSSVVGDEGDGSVVDDERDDSIFDEEDYNIEYMEGNQKGLAMMTFELLLDELASRARKESGDKQDTVTYTIEASALQVYLNKVYDVLSEDGCSKALLMRSRTIQETLTEQGRDVCDLHPELTRIPCENLGVFRDFLQRIVAARKQGCTHMNNRSSRSHLIITLAVRRTVNIPNIKPRQSAGTSQAGDAEADFEGIPSCSRRHYLSTLSLVDLAGSERDSARKGAVNEALLRAEGINVALSLTALSECLRERARNSARTPDAGMPQERSHGDGQHEEAPAGPPGRPNNAGLYRRSALTRLLKEPLTSAKIFFLACCSPAACCASATGQTLTYAAVVKHIRTNAEDSAILLEAGMDRFPIEFLPHHALVEHGGIPRSHQRMTVYLYELRACVLRIMVSHRWLSPSMDSGSAHPDSQDNKKHELICLLFKKLGEGGWIRNYDELKVVEWIDFGRYL